MQPLRDVRPLREIVFHVTKRGCDSSRVVLERVDEESEDVEEVAEGAGVSVPLLADEAVELVEGRLEEDEVLEGVGR